MEPPHIATGDKVFISSTLLDLGGYRRAVHSALRELGLIAVRLEQLWPQPPVEGRNIELVQSVAEQINDCKAVVAIKGARRGARVSGSDATFTDFELNAAAESRLPIFLFATPGSRFFEHLQSGHPLKADELAILENCIAVRSVASEDEIRLAVLDVFGQLITGAHPRRLIVLPRVNPDLIRELLGRPDRLQAIPDRVFEELVADLLAADGWSVELVVRSNAHGPDIVACSSQIVSGVPVRMLVECKRYADLHRIGVREVRNLVYWVNEQEQATLGMIAATTRFTRPARELVTERHRWRISLRDQGQMVEWLKRSPLSIRAAV